MFSFLQRDIPAVGRVLYPGTIPPPLESLPIFGEPVAWTRVPESPGQSWKVEARHPVWGKAEMACARQPAALADPLIEQAASLSETEKRLARLGEVTVVARVSTREGELLADRKRLLHWLRALMRPDGVIAVDETSMLLWSHSMLDDELAHDAGLDIEALYTIHAVYEAETKRVSWLHTHGLAELGAFDIDILEPSPMLATNCGDAIRALAFAALEGSIEVDTERFQVAYPGGHVRFVPVDRFHGHAAPEHRKLRDLDGHDGRRAVLCEPAGGLLGRWRTRPVPSRFLSTLDNDQIVFPFSAAATQLMSERARHTVGVFRDLTAEFDDLHLPALVKLGYEVEGGDADEREHLWFQVHGITQDTVEATLVNSPHQVPALTVGQRGEHALARLTDWIIMSPEGSMTPRNVGPARRLRETRSQWKARLDAPQQGRA